MSLNSAETRQVFPYPYADVFKGLVAVLPAAGYPVKSADETIGRVIASAGASLMSWGEDIVVQVIRQGDDSTEIVIQSNLKVGMNLAASAKNSQHAERIIGALSAYLRGGSRNVDKAVASAPSTNTSPALAIVILAIVVLALLPLLL